MPIIDLLPTAQIPPASASNNGLMTATDKVKLDGIGVATTDAAGLVKPDGETVTVDDDGTLTAPGGGGAIIWHEAQ